MVGKIFVVIIATIFFAVVLIIILKKMNVAKRIIRESTLVLVICIIGEIMAGIFLSDIEKFLSVLPGIIVLIPIVSGTRGSIMGIYCSRITSALHLGNIKPSFLFRDKILRENIIAIIFLSITIAFLSGAAAHYLSFIFGYSSAGLFKFVGIVLLASFFSDATLIITGTLASFITFKKGYDPDNLLFPINTTISDMISCLFLVLSVKLII